MTLMHRTESGFEPRPIDSISHAPSPKHKTSKRHRSLRALRKPGSSEQRGREEEDRQPGTSYQVLSVPRNISWMYFF